IRPKRQSMGRDPDALQSRLPLYQGLSGFIVRRGVDRSAAMDNLLRDRGGDESSGDARFARAPIGNPRRSMSSVKVDVCNLTKRFKLYPGPTARLAEWLTLGTWKRHTDFTAVNDVTFSVRAGEFFGILGP